MDSLKWPVISAINRVKGIYCRKFDLSVREMRTRKTLSGDLTLFRLFRGAAGFYSKHGPGLINNTPAVTQQANQLGEGIYKMGPSAKLQLE